MMRHDKAVKDKRIMLEGSGLFLAVVEYFQDRPERDNDTPQEKVFATIGGAQKWLSKFPRDAWTGEEFTSHNYKEIDERNSYVRRHQIEDNRRAQTLSLDRLDRIPGRSFARHP